MAAVIKVHTVLSSFQYKWGMHGTSKMTTALWSQRVVHFTHKFTFKGTSPTNHMCTVTEASDCLTTLLPRVFTQRNFIADFLWVKCSFIRKTALCIILHLWEGLETSYAVILRLIRKHVDLLLVIVELDSLGVTAETLRANIHWSRHF